MNNVIEKNNFPVLLAFGSNLGRRDSTLRNAWNRLKQTENIIPQRLSSFYETEPIGGPAGQPMFLNAAGIINTSLLPQELLAVLQKIETGFGRNRSEHSAEHWGPRTLDIDILLYADQTIALENLNIPHVEMLHRLFVLEPACEIAADWVHPITKKTLLEHRWKLP